jgi:hypothetical protein
LRRRATTAVAQPLDQPDLGPVLDQRAALPLERALGAPRVGGAGEIEEVVAVGQHERDVGGTQIGEPAARPGQLLIGPVAHHAEIDGAETGESALQPHVDAVLEVDALAEREGRGRQRPRARGARGIGSRRPDPQRARRPRSWLRPVMAAGTWNGRQD